MPVKAPASTRHEVPTHKLANMIITDQEKCNRSRVELVEKGSIQSSSNQERQRKKQGPHPNGFEAYVNKKKS